MLYFPIFCNIKNAHYQKDNTDQKNDKIKECFTR